MNVALADYDFVVVNSSGGKDSQSSLRFVVQQARAEGYPLGRIVVAHADLGRMEWPGTTELVKAQTEHYGLRWLKVARSEDLLAHIERRRMFPDSGNRYCTSDHKRDQIAKLFTELVRELPAMGRAVRVLNVMGMRAEESPARAKLAVFARNARVSSGVRVVDNWLPIHSWSLAEVWADIKASGVPYHHAYDLGMPRLSCMFCIFSPKEALMIAGRANPQLLDEYVQVEKRIGHTFRNKFALASVQAAIARGEDWGKATDWVM